MDAKLKIDPLLEDLYELTRYMGELDESAVRPAQHLLALPRYRWAGSPETLLVDDIKQVIESFDDKIREDARVMLSVESEHAGTSLDYRHKHVLKVTHGTAWHYRLRYTLARVALGLLTLQEDFGMSATTGVHLVGLKAGTKIHSSDHSQRSTHLEYSLRSTRSDTRIFIFQHGTKTLTFKDWDVVSEDPRHVKIGRAPLQRGDLRGAHLYAVYLGYMLPIGEPTTVRIVVDMEGDPRTEPWVSYATRYPLASLELFADVPLEYARSYKTIERESSDIHAPIVDQKTHDRSDDSVMTYRPAAITPGRRYWLEWYP